MAGAKGTPTESAFVEGGSKGRSAEYSVRPGPGDWKRPGKRFENRLPRPATASAATWCDRRRQLLQSRTIETCHLVAPTNASWEPYVNYRADGVVNLAAYARPILGRPVGGWKALDALSMAIHCLACCEDQAIEQSWVFSDFGMPLDRD